MRKPDFTRRIAVTGMGLVSPIGADIDTVWSNLVNGVSGLKRITYWDPEPYDCKVAGEVPDFDPNAWMNFKEVRRTDRNVVLGVAAAKKALAHSGLEVDGRQPRRHRRLLRLRRGRRQALMDNLDVWETKGAARGQPVLHRQHAARHGLGPDRDRDRASAGRTCASSRPARPAPTTSARRPS